MTTTERYGEVLFTFVSKSKPDKKPYEVRQLRNGHLSCNCPGYCICRSPKADGSKRCKHTDLAETLLGETSISHCEAVDELIAILQPRLNSVPSDANRLAMSRVLEKLSPAKKEEQQQTTASQRRIVFTD